MDQVHLSDLDKMSLKALFNDLVRKGDGEHIREKFNVSLPNWLTIKYRCANCREKQNIRIQKKSIKGINKYLRCPSCRKNSYASTIHVKENSDELQSSDIKGIRLKSDKGLSLFNF